MEILDASILTPAIPAIAAQFGVGAIDVNVAITAYLVTVAVLIPASGWMADRFGIRRVFIAAIAIFTLASVGCALSASLPMLVGMRIAQGVGGAMMVPVGRLAVLRFSGKADLVRAIALLTWPALAAPVLAPVLGGAIATVGNWRWIFLVNIPLGVIGLILAFKLIRGDPAPARTPLDWPGILLLGGGIAAALIGLEHIRVDGTDWLLVGGCGVAALALLITAVWHLLRTEAPLVALRVLKVRTLRITVSAGSSSRRCRSSCRCSSSSSSVGLRSRRV
jgi:MFS family permease